jgi:hypothetical protein
MSTIY